MDLSLVIPAYGEQARIGATLAAVSTLFDGLPERAEAIVVDDGSRDATAAIVRDAAARDPRIRLLQHPSNRGKGAAVRTGMLAALGELVFFMDTDLSVSLDHLPPCLELMRERNLPIVIGSRRAPGAVIVRQQPTLRQSLGQSFTLLTRLLLVWEIQDFTCGFKGFRSEVARVLFSAQERRDWAFDAEILYLAKLLGIGVHQYPVSWEHRDGSRVRLARDVWRTLGALAAIRRQVPARARTLRVPASRALAAPVRR